MKGIRVDSELLANAESNYVEIIDCLDDQAQAYADQFHSQVIVPFCDRHNLRFWSGNGVWYFEAPGTKGRTFLDPQEEILRWGQDTGNAVMKDDSHSVSGRSWVMTCGDEKLPEFLYNYSEIDRLLNLDFMGGSLGYWVADHKPSTFPNREWE
jgi:hypothetical protein